jgi:predicted HTH domain antitoxin
MGTDRGNTPKVVRVRDLKDNPTQALRAARDRPVLVLNRDVPEAVILSMRDLGPETGSVRLSLARALYAADVLSLGRASRLAGVPLQEFIEHLGAAGIPVLRLTPAELRRDIEVAEKVRSPRASSSTRRA